MPQVARPAKRSKLVEFDQGFDMSFSSRGNPDYPGIETGSIILDTELLAEKASALGDAGRKVEQALKRLMEFAGEAGEERQALVYEASQAVWAFFVQRELCGLRDQKAIIRDMAIPTEVLLLMGATPPKPKR
jgi:hypothetical protein